MLLSIIQVSELSTTFKFATESDPEMVDRNKQTNKQNRTTTKKGLNSTFLALVPKLLEIGPPTEMLVL